MTKEQAVITALTHAVRAATEGLAKIKDRSHGAYEFDYAEMRSDDWETAAKTLGRMTEILDGLEKKKENLK